MAQNTRFFLAGRAEKTHRQRHRQHRLHGGRAGGHVVLLSLFYQEPIYPYPL